MLPKYKKKVEKDRSTEKEIIGIVSEVKGKRVS